MQLRQYRLAKGLTLAALAQKVGVTDVSLSRYENGRMPRRAIVRKISEVTGGAVQANDFMLAPESKAAKPAPAKRRRKAA